MQRIPIIPTILVIAAACVMVWLGFWQLGRSEEKAEMIARFSAIPTDQPAEPLLTDSDWQDKQMFRRVSLNCATVASMRSTAGTAATGAKGFAHVASCAGEGMDQVEVVIGWSRDPAVPAFDGGELVGMVDASGKIVADPPLAGLDSIARPDPNDLPNNHLAYAGQWFFFALTALIIYGFALRSRAQKRR